MDAGDGLLISCSLNDCGAPSSRRNFIGELVLVCHSGTGLVDYFQFDNCDRPHGGFDDWTRTEIHCSAQSGLVHAKSNARSLLNAAPSCPGTGVHFKCLVERRRLH
jgi:hypothetical protein